MYPTPHTASAVPSPHVGEPVLVELIINTLKTKGNGYFNPPICLYNCKAATLGGE